MRFDYEASLSIAMKGPPFYGVIMAAMRLADTESLEKLRAAWPAVFEELQARYHAPGGYLPDELAAIERRAQEATNGGEA